MVPDIEPPIRKVNEKPRNSKSISFAVRIGPFRIRTFVFWNIMYTLDTAN